MKLLLTLLLRRVDFRFPFAMLLSSSAASDEDADDDDLDTPFLVNTDATGAAAADVSPAPNPLATWTDLLFAAFRL